MPSKRKTPDSIWRTAPINDLRQKLKKIQVCHGPSAPSAISREDSIRSSCQDTARRLALDLDKYWKKVPGAADGPIDVVDMFSGCGGMSAGFRAVNGLVPAFRLAVAMDIDKVANRTFASNLGIRPSFQDVSLLASDPKATEGILGTLGRPRKRPLVLIGCAPCQGFSSHRNSLGQTDHRNSLFLDFAKVATELLPDAVIVENVPELLTDRYWALICRARKQLENAGYWVHVAVHNMAEFGVPQERFRTLLMAMRFPFVPPSGFLPRSKFKTVRQAIGDLPPIAAGQRDPRDPMHYTAGHRESTLQVIRAVPKNGGNRPENLGPACLRRAKSRNGRGVYEDVYGRLFWDRPAITMTAYARNPASGRYIHPDQDRGLSVREAAILQGFPRTFHFEGSLDERFRQIGNAVPPRFSAFLAMHLLGELLSGQESSGFGPGITSPVGASFSRLIPSLKAGHRSLIPRKGKL